MDQKEAYRIQKLYEADRVIFREPLNDIPATVTLEGEFTEEDLRLFN